MQELMSYLVIPQSARTAAAKWKSKTIGIGAVKKMKNNLAEANTNTEEQNMQIAHLKSIVAHLEQAHQCLSSENETLKKDKEQILASGGHNTLNANSVGARGIYGGKNMPDGTAAKQVKAAEARAKTLEMKMDAMEHQHAKEKDEYERRIARIEAKLLDAARTEEQLKEDTFMLSMKVEDAEMDSAEASSRRSTQIKAMVKDEMANVFSRFDAQLRNTEEKLAREHEPTYKPASTWQYSSPHESRLHRVSGYEAKTKPQNLSDYYVPKHTTTRSPRQLREVPGYASPTTKLGVLHLPSRS
jgi:hypothetical protein